MELKIKKNESWFDFSSRVILNYKDYGFQTKEEVITKLTGVPMRDNSRKIHYGLRNLQKAYENGHYKQFLGEESVEGKKEELNSFYKTDEMIEVEDKELLLTKIKRLEKQLTSTQDNLRIARADNKKEYRTENIWDKFVKDFKYVEPIRIGVVKDIKYKSIAILNIADVHVGMLFENELNTYNKEVVVSRFKTLAEKTIRNLEPNTKLIVLQLGDEVAGNIHVSTRINADLNVVESLKLFTECMLGMLEVFCEYFKEVEYHSIHGNHSRITPSKEESLEKENFTCFSDWYIRLAMSKVENFTFPNNRIFGISEIDVFDKKIVALHGHQGSFESITKVAHTVGYIPSQVNIGHLHTFHNKDFGRTRVIGNPSFCGLDSYASDKLYFGLPHQLLEVFYENGDKETKELYL